MKLRWPRRGPRAPSFLTSFATIALTDLALRRLGFARSVALARRFGKPRRAENDRPELTDKVCRRLALAAVFYPGRARCLEQSLALYVLLRRRGVPVRLRLGVQPYPFNAHAWVELNGAPLNERVETVRQFVPFEDFAV
jgi:transglutaminase-like putative cysteine protease